LNIIAQEQIKHCLLSYSSFVASFVNLSFKSTFLVSKDVLYYFVPITFYPNMQAMLFWLNIWWHVLFNF